MKKPFFVLFALSFSLFSCFSSNETERSAFSSESSISDRRDIPTLNDEYYRGFSMDNVLSSSTLGDIHYNVYLPETYDGSKPYALYFTLPGYQGLYRFQVGANLKTETFAFEAIKYVDDRIVVAPQLNDWGETSARQTIELTQLFNNHFNID